MKVSYKHLQNLFDGKLPSPEVVADALTFHAWEIEEVTKVGDDTVLDVKVLPDKSAWALSHRGIAKDLSAILSIPLFHDPLAEKPVLGPLSKELSVRVDTGVCRVYTAALIRGVKIGESPAWLRDELTAFGQRSINNVVDMTNFIMFGLGQPLHAFDAQKLSTLSIAVRAAKEGETITTLTGETYTLTAQDTLIVDGANDTPLGIAGIKGGKHAEVDANTVDIVVESANFDPLATRKSSQRLRLRTDASTRYENGVVPELAYFGVTHAALLITKFCGGTLEGYASSPYTQRTQEKVSATLSKINSVLGLSLSQGDVENILKRFGFVYDVAGDSFSVTTPFERPDLVIAEDLIEEIGRIYGYEHVPSIKIEPIPLREVNKRFYYAEAVRDALVAQGFSEIFTSSFRDEKDGKDIIKLKNALASDKGYLRSDEGILDNMRVALTKNAPAVDLFDTTEQVRLFEIGTVFDKHSEHEVIVLGVQSKQGFVPKKDIKILDDVLQVVKNILKTDPVKNLSFPAGDNRILFNFTVALENLQLETDTYTTHEKTPDVTYKPFSNYPYLTRDIAFWTPAGTSAADAEKVVNENAGELKQRVDPLGEPFERDGRVSYGFRIVFQSYEKTLDGTEADALMQTVSDAVRACGWEVR